MSVCYLHTYIVIIPDTGLAPYTEYQYSVVTANGAGTAQSEYAKATTHQKLPEGVQPPTGRVDTNQLDTIYLSWEPPTKPNGNLETYDQTCPIFLSCRTCSKTIKTIKLTYQRPMIQFQCNFVFRRDFVLQSLKRRYRDIP